MTRVTWSVEPPAAQGTMIVMGFSGFHCAAAGAATTSARPAAMLAAMSPKGRPEGESGPKRVSAKGSPASERLLRFILRPPWGRVSRNGAMPAPPGRC